MLPSLVLLFLLPCMQFGSYSHEAASGVHLTEQLLGARSLCRLLTLQLFNQLDVKIHQEAESKSRGRYDGRAWQQQLR